MGEKHMRAPSHLNWNRLRHKLPRAQLYSSALLVSACLVISGCNSGSETASGSCGDTSECGGGMVCEQGTCVPACFDASGCEPHQFCANSLCVDASCGNGEVEANEGCDNGVANSDSAACTASCTVAQCGDAFIFAGEETCDDGNTVDDDGCDSNCKPTGCGNGVVTSGEACDDGNLIDYDGCDSDCTITECPPSMAEGALCGDDGIFCNGPEICSDGSCVSAGNPCVEDALDCTPVLCDEDGAACNPLSPGHCLIAEICVTNFERNPENSCEYCDPDESPSEWQSFGEDLTLSPAAYWFDEGAALGNSCGVGACTGGTVVCGAPAFDALVCTTSTQASSEVCNLLDDDCDGAYDEGFWVDSSNVNENGEEEDFPDAASSETPAYKTYPDISNGVISGRILPAGDVDIIRIDATEDLSDIAPDAPFRAELVLSSASGSNSDNWYWLCACWSHNDPTCLYNLDVENDCWLATGTSPAEPPVLIRENNSTVLDLTTLWVRVQPYMADIDYNCNPYNLAWTIFEN